MNEGARLLVGGTRQCKDVVPALHVRCDGNGECDVDGVKEECIIGLCDVGDVIFYGMCW